MTDLHDIRAFLMPHVQHPTKDLRKVAEPKPKAAIKREARAKEAADKLDRIAVLDMETTPFDSEKQTFVFPFCAMLYSDQFETITIWNEDREGFISDVIAAIEGLPDDYTIYAHNGGKFDWQFLLYKLRGQVSFKGRGIMSARIGRHTIRDSFHLLPEKLAAYRKDAFDYGVLVPELRNQHRTEILDYLKSDCVYLFELLHHFTQEHGLKISIGQAAMAAVRAAGYKVQNLGENSDAFLRHFYFGGRVECIQGKGHFDGPWKLYDVNSMYPAGMAQFKHPFSRAFEIRDGEPGPNTIFIELECENHGALVARGPDGETSALNGYHTFKTTIHEYNVAIKYGLIEDVKIKWCIDFPILSTFENFVVPRYERRQTLKAEIKSYKAANLSDSEACQLAMRNDLTEKYLLNNAYGKFAQNPRNYNESYITDIGMRPPDDPKAETGQQDPATMSAAEITVNAEIWDDLPALENPALGYAIWERPVDVLRFRNVATAASITGACRAVLLEAMCNAVDPIYCDTDSLICRDLVNTPLDDTKLGHWDLEDTFTRVIIAGKKTYACDRGAHKATADDHAAHVAEATAAGVKPTPFDDWEAGRRYKIRSKGTSGLTWRDMEDMLDAEIGVVAKRAKGPTIYRDGRQVYIQRRIRATAGPANRSLLDTIQKRLTA